MSPVEYSDKCKISILIQVKNFSESSHETLMINCDLTDFDSGLVVSRKLFTDVLYSTFSRVYTNTKKYTEIVYS